MYCLKIVCSPNLSHFWGKMSYPADLDDVPLNLQVPKYQPDSAGQGSASCNLSEAFRRILAGPVGGPPARCNLRPACWAKPLGKCRFSQPQAKRSSSCDVRDGKDVTLKNCRDHTVLISTFLAGIVEMSACVNLCLFFWGWALKPINF